VGSDCGRNGVKKDGKELNREIEFPSPPRDGCPRTFNRSKLREQRGFHIVLFLFFFLVAGGFTGLYLGGRPKWGEVEGLGTSIKSGRKWI
jgi:hypothetical protein